MFIVACGTAFHSGLVAKYAIEHWARMPVEIDIASEFRYRDPVLDANTLTLGVSQSGETIDTLEAVRHARHQRSHVLAITNTVGSAITREASGVMYTHAGPEIGVAATKTFATQMAALHLVALYLAQTRGTLFPDEVVERVRMLQALPEQVERTLSSIPRSRRSRSGTPPRPTSCSSGATRGTRLRSRARSSSRRSPTSTPRGTPPASSSTGRSR